MTNNLWIFVLFGFFLLAQGLPHPAENDTAQDSEDYPGDDADKDNENEENGPAPILHSKNQSLTFDVGDTARLPCKIENDKSVVVLWWMDQSILWTDTVPQGSVTHPNFKLGDDHSVTIHNIKAEDSAKYNCSLMDGSSQSVVYDVRVADKPKILRTIPKDETKIEKGTPLTLMCEAAGYPTPVISWYKKTKHNYEKIEGTKVVIDSANRKHNGTYECRATNSKGEDTKKVDIHVQYEPEVEVEKDVVFSGEGYESELVCTVHAEPKAKVSWLKDDQPLVFGHSHIELSDNRNKHYLRISGTTKNDFGVYRCIGQNNRGTNSQTITLSGRPTKPIFHAAEQAPDSKNPVLSWSIDSFAPISDYEFLYRPQDKSQQGWVSVDVVVDGPVMPKSTKFIAKHTFDGLEPVVYQAQIRAKNIFGWSELSDPHSFNGQIVDIDNNDEVSQTGLLESAQNNHANTASELRISIAFLMSLLVARFYC